MVRSDLNHVCLLRNTCGVPRKSRALLHLKGIKALKIYTILGETHVTSEAITGS
jgi:hypothetical protein